MNRSLAALGLMVVLFAMSAPPAGAVAWRYPPGPPFRSCPDTLTLFDIQQSDTTLAPCHPAPLDTIDGVSGIITGMDARPTGFSFYIQNTFVDGEHPWTGVNVFTGSTNYKGLVRGSPTGGFLAVGDSVTVYGRTVEFQNGTELEGPDGFVATNDIAIRRIASGHPLPPPHVGTCATFNWRPPSVGSAPAESWEGCLVRIEGPLEVTLTSGTGIPVFGAFILRDPTAPGDSVLVDCFTLTTMGAPPVSTTVDYVQGILDQRTTGGITTYRIEVRDANDIAVVAAPNLVDAYPLEDNKLRLVFDKNLDEATAEIANNYGLLSGSATVNTATLVGGAGTTVELDITTALSDGDLETVSASGIGSSACPACLSATQQLNFVQGVISVAAIQAPDVVSLGGACEDRSRFAGTGPAIGRRLTVRGVAVQDYSGLFYIADAVGGPRSGASVFAPTTELVRGHQYRLSAGTQEFQGETEIAGAVDVLDEGVATVPAPTLATVAQLRDPTCDAGQSLTTGEDFEGSLVRTWKAKIVANNTAPTNPPPGGSFRIVQPATPNDTLLVSNNGSHYTFDPEPNMVLDVAGVMHVITTAFQLQPRGDTDLMALTAIQPNTGGDEGPVTVAISGYGFQAGTTAALSKSGQPLIAGSVPLVGTDGRSLTTTLDLSGKLAGLWDVIVTYPDAHTDTLAQAFTIEATAAPQLRVALIGPSMVAGNAVVRRDRRTAFDLVIDNPGNVDLSAVPLWVTGIPTDATVQADFTISYPPQVSGEPDWSTVPLTFSSAAGRYLPLLIPRVSPGTTTLRLLVTVPGPTHDPFQLTVAVTPPWVDGAKFRSCLLGGGITDAACMGVQLDSIQAYLAARPEVSALSGIALWARAASRRRWS